MRALGPLGMIVLGGILAVAGVLLPLFMILGMIQTSFLWSFVAYGASFAGVMLGVVGSALYVRSRRPRGEE